MLKDIIWATIFLNSWDSCTTYVMSCGDINLRTPSCTVNYLENTFSENVDVPESKFERVVYDLPT